MIVARNKRTGRRKLPLVATAMVTLLVAGGASQVFAETYNLERCLKEARENRASIVIARGSKSNASAETRRQFGRLFLPDISSSYRISESKEREQSTEVIDTATGSVTTIGIPDQDRSGRSYSVTGSLTLFDGLSNVHDYLGVRKDSKRASNDLKRAEQNLDLTVKLSYFAYLANVSNLTVQVEAVNRSQEQLNLVQSKYDIGSSSLSDVLKQKVQFGNDNLSLLEARQRLLTSKADLAYVVGLDPDAEIEYDTTYIARQYVGTLAEATKTGLAGHPGLRSKKLSVSVANHYAKSAYGDYFPRVAAFVTHSWSRSSRSDVLVEPLDFESRSTTVGLDVRWNIFDRFSRERNIVRNRVSHNNAKAELRDLRNSAVLEIRKAFYEVEKAIAQVEVSGETVVSASQDINLAQEKHKLGSASILDLLDAQVSLKDAQVKLIKARLDHNVAVAKLENAMGVSR